MKMQSMNFILFLLLSSSSLSTTRLHHRKQTVYFCSKNFHNIVRWQPMKPAFPGEKVVYSVSYARYGEGKTFKIKAECQNITELTCDMTEETPSLHNIYYRARVHANGRLLGITERFKPLAETTFGQLTLKNYTKGSSLYIDTTLPLGPNGGSIEDIIINSKQRPVETPIYYTLHINSPDWAVDKVTNTIGKFIIDIKNNHTVYCGNVFYSISYERGRPDSELAKFCFSVQDTHTIPLQWPLMSAALLAAIVVIAVVCSCIYIRGGKTFPPPSLVEDRWNRQNVLNHLYPSDDPVISKVTVCPPEGKTGYAIILTRMFVPAVGSKGYTPQDICNSWQSSISFSDDAEEEALPLQDQQENSSQSSDIYGSVAVQAAGQSGVHVQVGVDNRGNGGQQFNLSGDEGGARGDRTLHGAPTFPNPGVCEPSSGMPLLLHTMRDSDGKLVLPSLPFQSDGGPDGSSSPFQHETTPLLSDLIGAKTGGLSLLERLDSSELSDSGCDDSCVNTPTQPYCNSSYLSSRAVAPCPQSPFTGDGQRISGYKQNWMPADQPGTQTEDDCPSESHYRRTNFPATSTEPYGEVGEEEVGDADWKEESKQISLERWGLRFQE